MKNKNNFLISLISILLVIINIVSVISYSNNQKYIIKLNNNFNAELTKIFIIGDSRMELLNNERDTLNIPSNIVFKARSGAKIF